MKKTAPFFINLFVIFWILLFHYESLRYFYLSPLFGRELPKTPMLFPPAGWIMFYQIPPEYSTAAVTGITPDGREETIDPHRIMTPDFIGFDNIHRNIMVHLLDRREAGKICRYLHWKFPGYQKFRVHYVVYPELVPPENQKKSSMPVYQC